MLRESRVSLPSDCCGRPTAYIPCMNDIMLDLWMHARNALVTSHLHLVRAVASSFTRQARAAGLDEADLVGHGSLTLIRAAETYDEHRHPGKEFAEWATFMLFREFSNLCLVTQGQVRIPKHVEAEARQRYRDSLRTSYLALDPLSDSPDPAEEVVGRERAQRAKVVLRKLLRALPAQERHVLRMLHLKGWSVERVASKLGVSTRKVLRLERAALARLKGER